MIHSTKTLSNTQTAEQLSKTVATKLKELLLSQERVTFAVSGGKYPIEYFQILSQADLDWDRVNVTLVDERLVPIDHDESNTGLAHKYLLQNKAKVAKWIPVVSEHATEESLKDTDQALNFALQHYIKPDILVLGMGPDGHTASLFPKAPQFSNAIDPNYPKALIHTTPITAPFERITMTLSSIESTPNIYLALSGSEKLTIYKQAEQEIIQKFPISYILNSKKAMVNVIYND